jgi:beta-mannosidase
MMQNIVDLLEGANWECRRGPPGELTGPSDLTVVEHGWFAAEVPGTVASAQRSAGEDPDAVDYDAFDWWFRCRFRGAPDAVGSVLRLEGLATIADIWLNDRHLAHTENMFRVFELGAEVFDGENELLIRFASLKVANAQKRPRPRWKSYLIAHQNLRFVRTTLLGRLPGWAETPAPVGPYRAVRLLSPTGPRVVSARVRTTCVGDGGEVEVEVCLRGVTADAPFEFVVGEARTPAARVREADGEVVVAGRLDLPAVERWWPHTHGAQPLYDLDLEVAGERLRIRRIGFRTVEVDRTDGGFRLIVNGVPIFARGAVWMPVDPVSMRTEVDRQRSMLELAKSANLNIVRPPGTGVYQEDSFWDDCDELGIMVWYECMLAFYDPPSDPGFQAELEAELTQQFEIVSGRPALALVCGSQETEEQAAMNSPSLANIRSALLDETIPKLVEDLLPGVGYVTSNPTGGAVPYQMDSGVSQYFGIGGYLRPIEDARRSNVRFAAECLAFATPPERRTVDEECGGSFRAGHDPTWKRSVHHDAGRSWDLEDMQGYYVRKLFGLDPFELRYGDPDRSLDISRATVATLYERVLSEWRRSGSSCAGAIVLALGDLRLGAGWGVIDALGRPKAPWFALKRVLSPVGLVLTDEGLNGLHAHLLNDRSEELSGILRVELFVRGEMMVESAEQPVVIPGRSATLVEVAGMFDGFRDLTAAYGFGPPANDLVRVVLLDSTGVELASVVHLPGGGLRQIEPDLGLEAELRSDARRWVLEISTRRFAQWVVIETPGYLPGDSWFHLAPGAPKSVVLEPETGSEGPPTGEVRALNSSRSVRLVAR